jgi:hypothetical protein
LPKIITDSSTISFFFLSFCFHCRCCGCCCWDRPGIKQPGWWPVRDSGLAGKSLEPKGTFVFPFSLRRMLYALYQRRSVYVGWSYHIPLPCCYGASDFQVTILCITMR